MTNPTGAQYSIRYGTSEAHVTETGATLRAYAVDGVDVLDGFGIDQRATDGRGQVLAPWPNRIASGRYRYGGREVQCPINEPARDNAIHGLVRWIDWQLVDHQPASVTLSCAVRPQPGYEWPLHLEVSYELATDGLQVRFRAVNTGRERAPFGAGFHPYLKVHGCRVDDLELTLPATQFLDLDGSGTPALPVAGTDFDFRTARRVGSLQLDTAYTGLVRTSAGRATAELTDRNSGSTVGLWVGNAYRHLMVYTGDKVSQAERRRAAVAVEPMTCPPQAFRTGIDVLELEPGESWSGDWGLSARR